MPAHVYYRVTITYIRFNHFFGLNYFSDENPIAVFVGLDIAEFIIKTKSLSQRTAS